MRTVHPALGKANTQWQRGDKDPHVPSGSGEGKSLPETLLLGNAVLQGLHNAVSDVTRGRKSLLSSRLSEGPGTLLYLQARVPCASLAACLPSCKKTRLYWAAELQHPHTQHCLISRRSAMQI